MNIRQLEYFIAVAKCGSFAQAANSLFISHQALNKAVRNLERQVGSRLLVSQGNRLALTDLGARLLADAAPVVRSYRDLERRYEGLAGGPRPPQRALSVALGHGTALSLPKDTIDSFRSEHPDILLSLEEVTTEAAIGMVRSGDADVGLVGSVPAYISELDLALVAETGVFLYLPKDDPLALKGVLDLTDLDGRPFITFGRRNHLHRYFVETCEAAGVHPDILMTTSDVNLLVRSAEEQRAYYFGFPTAVYAETGSDCTLVPVEMGRDDTFGTYAVRCRGIPLSTAAQALWDHLTTR